MDRTTKLAKLRDTLFNCQIGLEVLRTTLGNYKRRKQKET